MEASLKAHLLRELMHDLIGPIFNHKEGYQSQIPTEHWNSLPYVYPLLLAGKETFAVLRNFVSTSFIGEYYCWTFDIHYKARPGECDGYGTNLLTELHITYLFLRLVTHISIDPTIYGMTGNGALCFFHNRNIAILSVNGDHSDDMHNIAKYWNNIRTLKCDTAFYELLSDFCTSRHPIFKDIEAVSLRGSFRAFKPCFLRPNLRQLPAFVELNFVNTKHFCCTELKMPTQTIVKQLNLEHSFNYCNLNTTTMNLIAAFLNNFPNLEICRLTDDSRFYPNQKVSPESIKTTMDAFLEAPFKPGCFVDMVFQCSPLKFNDSYKDPVNFVSKLEGFKNTTLIRLPGHYKLVTNGPGRKLTYNMPLDVIFSRAYEID
uniref:ORF12 n=1 Tax=Panagrellus redivivus TaxID=6233 RepID=A0A7E4VEM5_PANRE